MMQAQFRNAKDHAEAMVSHASAASEQLAEGAQSTVQHASERLADWAERGQKAALWSLGSRKARGLMLSKPFLSLALVAGAGAVVTYMLMRRYGYVSPQTGARPQVQNKRRGETVSPPTVTRDGIADVP